MIPPLNYTAYKITMTRGDYGDFIGTSETALPCHFRDITDVQYVGNSDQFQSDAMAWFKPDSGIVKDDILKIDGEHWRVERVTEARNLLQNKVEFIKTELSKYGPIS